MRSILLKTLGLTVLLLLTILAFGGGYLRYIGDRPLAAAEQTTPATQATTASGSRGNVASPAKRILRIPAGQSLRHFATALYQKGWVPEPYSVRLWAWLDWPGKSIRTGEYAIGPNDSLRKILQTVFSGQTIRYPLTIPEGRTFRQFLTVLNAAPYLQHELTTRSEKEIMALLGYPGEQPEGRFFPDTYQYSSGMKSLEILRTAYARMQTVLRQAWTQRQRNLAIKTPYEALILASIIEKETAAAEERPLISAVFHNRLRRNMRLQTDPTVIYGMGARFQGNLRRRDLRQDTPYNTYTRFGLPPTPIALPGKKSIFAALHPTDSKALYFVAKGNGYHYFSTSLAEHNRAVDQFQRRRKRKHIVAKRS